MSFPSFPFLKSTTFAILLFLWICVIFVEASSPPPRPLKRLAQPSIHTLEILPRSPSLRQRSFVPFPPSPVLPDAPMLQHSDSFRLIFAAFDQTFHLHLRPNPHILHSSARINYYTNGPNGEAILDRTEPLLRSSVRAYWGEVMHPDVSHGRLREDSVGGLLNPESQPLGWARIMVHHQGDVDTGLPPVFEGAFSVNGDIHHVMTKDNYLRTKHPLDPRILSNTEDPSSSLVVFRDSDIMNHNEETIFRASGIPFPSSDKVPMSNPNVSSCSHDRLKWNSDPSLNPVLRQSKSPTWFEMLGFRDWDISVGGNISNRVKRNDVAGTTSNSNFAGNIGQSAGCPIQQMIVYTGVAADCKYVQQYGSAQNATTAILNDWNMASGVYKTTFNISLGIVQLDMHDSTCPSPPDPIRPWNVDCSTVTLNDRLSLFSKWRGDKGQDGTGLWHLMSGCPTNAEVGVAWLGTLCQTTVSGSPGSFVSGTAVTTASRSEWQVVAHETGHNFGAIHDCTSGCPSTTPCCPLSTSQCDTNSKFIMSPTTSQAEGAFSSCSLGNICSLMQSKTTNLSCIQLPDPTKQTLSFQMCGNGIVEPGEDCDPGQGANSTCCNPKTCKFTPGSVCDSQSSACCTPQCQFAPSTQVCRPSQDSNCDIPESCTGTSATCPWDRTQPNGKSCGSNGLACASGQCTSESKQCQTIGSAMGLTAACPNKGDTSCQVSCQDPQNSKQCVVLQAQLIDGSPCGYGGQCSGGTCNQGSILNMAKAWYLANLRISIPVTVIAGIFVLYIIYSLICCMRRCYRNRRSKSTESALSAIPPQRLNSWVAPPPESVAPTAPEPGVWIPPPRRGNGDATTIRSSGVPPPALRLGSAASSRRGQPSIPGGGFGVVPPVLRPGSAASPPRTPSFSTNPPAAYSGARGGRSPPIPNSAGNISHWVDPTAWNGPPR